MPTPKHGDAPPDLPGLLGALQARRVRYVIVGSMAAQLYGVEGQPRDLDIAPDPDPENLARLAQVLVDIEAVLPETDQVGHWELQPDGERKWVSRQATPEDLEKRAAWFPDPSDISTFDHSFHTRHGNLDVVPELYGGFETLIRRARAMTVHDFQVWVAHVDELLAALTIPRRKKDVPRVQKLRHIQRILD
jgi:hypothetical protein